MYTNIELEFYDHSSYECDACHDKQLKLDDIKYWLKNLVCQMYDKDMSNIHEIENCLDEMAHVVGFKLPEQEIQIERKREDKVQPLPSFYSVEEWKNWATKKIINS